MPTDFDLTSTASSPGSTAVNFDLGLGGDPTFSLSLTVADATISASGTSTVLMTLDLTVAGPSIDASDGSTISTVDQTVSGPTLSATLDNFDASVSLTVAAPSIVAAIGELSMFTTDLTVAGPTLSATIETGTYVNAVVAGPTIEFAVSSGNGATLDLVVAPASLYVEFAWAINLTVAAPTLEASSATGAAIALDLAVAPVTLQASLRTENLARVDATVPGPTLDSAIASGNLAGLTAQVQGPALLATGASGANATLNLSVAGPTVLIQVGSSGTLSTDVIVAGPTLLAEATSSFAETFRSWAMNTRKGFLSEYTNFRFNSYTLFNGKLLAAGPNGIMELGEQDADDDAPIDSVVTTGYTDFDSTWQKRVPRLYFTARVADDVQFWTVADEQVRKYLITFDEVTSLKQRRVPIGRGPKARFWGFGFANHDGADFELASMIAVPEAYRRRVF